MLARQLKLRLIAEDGSDIPRSCSNVVVSIHAIATFQAFNDYLRPRILAATALAERANGTGAPGGRLSSFLAAFAAAGDEHDEAEASGSGLSISPGTMEITTTPAKATTTDKQTRRRSSRLSGKMDSTSATVDNTASTSMEVAGEFEDDEDHEVSYFCFRFRFEKGY